MRIIFMGTPDFAVPSLKAVIDRGDEICGVFTQPDKPKGRGHKMQPPPVKELALQQGLPVFQPATLRDESIQNAIAGMEPDAIVVVAYGKLLPPSVLAVPRLGCVNVHGSLLPKYRGAAPIQWAVLNGEKTTGVTTMFMAEGMDTGDMLLKAETDIGPEETAGELFDRLKLMGAELLTETLDRLEEGSLERIPQDDSLAVLAPMLKKEMSAVDWNRTAIQIHDQIRGLNPWPYVAATIDGKRVKLLASQITSGDGAPGTAHIVDGELLIACGQGMLKITELQTETGKRMSGKSYLLGHAVKEGTLIE